MHRRPVLAALAALTLIAAGCGSDDDEGGSSQASTATTAARPVTAPTPPATPARAGYIRKADAYCRRTNTVAVELNQQAAEAIKGAKNDKDRLAALAPVLAKGAKEQRKATDGFLAIPVPAAEKAAVEPYRQTLRKQADAVDALAAATKAGDAAAFAKASQESQTIRRGSEAFARGLGMKDCSGAGG